MSEEKPIEAEVVPTQALAVRHDQPVAATGLFGTTEPSEVIVKASAVATALKDVVVKQGLVSNIQGKQYPRCEAWTLLGTMLGVFPVCVWTRQKEGGWEARVEARTRDGSIIGAAEAECLKSEKNWKDREDFAIRSMAQTRATAKCLRMPLGFIMTMAGYEATPAEEMVVQQTQPTVPPPKKQSKPVAASKPRSATAATRTWFAEQVKAADAVEEALQFMIELGWLMPNEGMADVPLRFVPNTKGEGSKLDLFFKHMRAWIGGGEALAPYEPDWDAEPGKNPVEVPREESEPGQTSAAALEPWYNFIVPIPQKGMKRDEYLKHPDTIGSLYEARHGDDEESQAKRQRLWGFLNHFEPKPYKGKISDTDVKFREMLDTFGEWFEKNHPEEKI